MSSTATLPVLVAFASANGSTMGVAECLAQELRERRVPAVALPVTESLDLTAYRAAIVGSAIHNGAWLPEARAFVDSSAPALRAMPVWLFSVSTIGDRESAFSPRVGRMLRRARGETREIAEMHRAIGAREHRNFAGVVSLGRTTRAGRWFLRAFHGHDGDYRNWPAIRTWADAIADELATPAGSAAAGTAA